MEIKNNPITACGFKGAVQIRTQKPQIIELLSFLDKVHWNSEQVPKLKFDTLDYFHRNDIGLLCDDEESKSLQALNKILSNRAKQGLDGSRQTYNDLLADFSKHAKRVVINNIEELKALPALKGMDEEISKVARLLNLQ